MPLQTVAPSALQLLVQGVWQRPSMRRWPRGQQRLLPTSSWPLGQLYWHWLLTQVPFLSPWLPQLFRGVWMHWPEGHCRCPEVQLLLVPQDPGTQGATQLPPLQMLPQLQPPRLSSAPLSEQPGCAVGEAQVVTPRRQGPRPWVQATPALQGVTQLPLLQTSPPGQPPLESSAPLSEQTAPLVAVTQVVVPLRQGLIPSVQGTLLAQRAAQVPPLQTWSPVQPPLESSAPMSAQPGALVGVAQVVDPWRHGPMPVVQG